MDFKDQFRTHDELSRLADENIEEVMEEYAKHKEKVFSKGFKKIMEELDKKELNIKNDEIKTQR